ncbi:MAG: hypothetical protein GJ680_18195 [Alteromonadaceae bacterium]|nr:hypothetical protein [Alteromonadaceae bacterium]
MIHATDALLIILRKWGIFIGLFALLFQMQKYYIFSLQRIGGRPLMLFPASFSVPVHELSHALSAICFGHKITEIKLFTPNGAGTLGYVNHSWRPTLISPFSNAIIGMAPIAGGLAAIYGLTLWLMPDMQTFIQSMPAVRNDDALLVAQIYFENLYALFVAHMGLPMFWLWLFLMANIAVFAAPSSVDFEGSAVGLTGFFGIYLVAVMFSPADNSIHQTLLGVVDPVVPILILSALSIGILCLLLTVIRLLLRR